MSRRLFTLLIALMGLRIAVAPLSAQPGVRPVYVVLSAPRSFPGDFTQKAVSVIQNCCPGVRAALSCPAGLPCENVLMDDDSGREFTIDVGTHEDLKPFKTSKYLGRMTPDERMNQVLDWLTALIKCDDVHNHGGTARDLARKSAYCQVCQLSFDTRVDTTPRTKD
jgi:hypothetical protein